MRRFYYSAILNGAEKDGVVHADSIDSARRELQQKGFEEINLTILSSLSGDFGQDILPASDELGRSPTP
ncbi:MAG: hypothetical protein Kow0099_07430 [Candidatus Abyssubacteria bacterium]